MKVRPETYHILENIFRPHLLKLREVLQGFLDQAKDAY